MKENTKSGNKRLAVNMIANIVSYSSTLLVSFVLTPYLINTLGKEAYSFYPLANNFVSYMTILTNALNSMANRYITMALTKKEYDKANTYFSSILFSNVIMAGVLLIPMALIVVFIDTLLVVPVNLAASVRILFSFSFATMLVNIITSVFGVATFSKNRIDLRSLRELITSLLRLALFVVFFTCFTPSIVYVGIVALIIALVNFGFQRFYTRYLLPEISIDIKKFNFGYVKEVLFSGIWNSINSLGNMLLASTSLILVNKFYGANAGGEYSIVQTVPNFINGIISMLTGVFYPMIMIKYAQNDIKGMLGEIKKSQRIVGLFSVSVIGVFIGMSYDFFKLWTPGQDYRHLVLLSTITILPHCIIGCIWSLSNVNIALNKIKVPALYMLGSGILNIILATAVFKIFKPDVFAVPLISSIIQIVLVAIFMPLYSTKQLNIKWYTFYPTIIRGGFACIFAVVLSVAVRSAFALNSWVKLIGIGASVGIVVLIINSLIILDKKSRKSLFNSLAKKIHWQNRI